MGGEASAQRCRVGAWAQRLTARYHRGSPDTQATGKYRQAPNLRGRENTGCRQEFASQGHVTIRQTRGPDTEGGRPIKVPGRFRASDQHSQTPRFHGFDNIITTNESHYKSLRMKTAGHHVRRHDGYSPMKPCSCRHMPAFKLGGKPYWEALGRRARLAVASPNCCQAPSGRTGRPASLKHISNWDTLEWMG